MHFQNLFNIIHKRLVHQPDASRCGIMASEVPVARVVGTGVMQALDALEHQFHRRLHTLRTQHLHNLRIDILDGEGLIDPSDVVRK